MYLAKYRTSMIFKYDLDYGNLGDSTCSVLTYTELLTYFSIAWRSNRLAILLVVMIIPLFSTWIKSATMFNLMFFRTLLMFMTWVLESLMKLLVLLMFMGTMTYFCNGLLVVMLIFGFGFLVPLMIFWTILIFLFWRLENASLSFKIFLAVLGELEELANTWVYDFFWLLEGFFLKYFNILLTSLAILAGMGEEREETYNVFTVFLPLGLVGFLAT